MGFSETAFLVILGLLLFGPKKLPEMARHFGRLMAEFRRASAEFQNQLNDEVRQLEREVEETKQQILPPVGITARIDSFLDDSLNDGNPARHTAPEPAVEVQKVEPEAESGPLGRAVTQGPNA